MVEKRWRVACEKEGDDDFKYHVLPNDSELAAAFIDRKKRLVQTFLLQWKSFGLICFLEICVSSSQFSPFCFKYVNLNSRSTRLRSFG